MKHEELISQWAEVSKQLRQLKNEELRLRNLVLNQIRDPKVEGSKTLVFGGAKITAKWHLNYSIDEAELAIIWPDLSELEQAAIKYKPQLDMRQYRQLPENNMLNVAITAKPGQPALELKE